MRHVKLLLGAALLLAAAAVAFYLNTSREQPPGSASIPSQQRSNRLSQETSPYLLQHADNPIWWFPWGEEAFETARRENKPIFLSVGYSTCYWCHFMEKDSFEKDDVAALLNKSFVAIKVDREERPDVDRIYMASGRFAGRIGGWPMNVFMTPDRNPFFARSTIRHDEFIQILNQVAGEWESDSGKLIEKGARVAGQLEKLFATENPSRKADSKLLRAFYRTARGAFDRVHAGFGTGRKFPSPHALATLLRLHRRSGDEQALGIVTHTLKTMARGGLHDVLGGGFHRYCVDREWMVPHFEKMLYDNASLVDVYLDAYQVTRDAEFALVARKTLDWVLAEMTGDGGGFYSAQDAGEVGEEGDYYAWDFSELEVLLTAEELSHAQKTFGFSRPGNFEGRNIFHIARATTFPDPVTDPLYASAVAKLRAARERRKQPRIDDKILTAWNGLMIGAMARGYSVLGDDRYLLAAQKAARFIRENGTTDDGHLMRVWRAGRTTQRGLANDYAFLIHGLLEIYQADFDRRWFDWAVRLQSIQDRDFWDDVNDGYYFDDAKDETLLARTKEYVDRAVPSANSISAFNLLRLADFTYDETYRSKANKVIRAASFSMGETPFGHPRMMIALDYQLDRSKEIAIIGEPDDDRTGALLATIRQPFLPNKIVAMSSASVEVGALRLLERKVAVGGQATAYVCETGICKLPTTDPAEALKLATTFEALKL